MQTATGKGAFSHILFYFIIFFKPLKFSETAAAGCPRCAAVPQNALMSLVPHWVIDLPHTGSVRW